MHHFKTCQVDIESGSKRKDFCGRTRTIGNGDPHFFDIFQRAHTGRKMGTSFSCLGEKRFEFTSFRTVDNGAQLAQLCDEVIERF